MYSENRDLLVLLKHELMKPQDMEREVAHLHELLFHIEQSDNIAKAHEIIDLNKYKVIRKAVIVKDYIRSKKEIPFVFLNNRN
ncbi:MAG: hypothetical protein ABS68_08845 [Niastella sp. SCN 39-18]|nr:MAG: hypothetical protein ABS68_08845 [Niastella sp. SCN 39-18]OJW11805.1 MAG: hypothetical protein BGO53_12910 [Sphingobacteriales bacterium 39-19]